VAPCAVGERGVYLWLVVGVSLQEKADSRTLGKANGVYTFVEQGVHCGFHRATCTAFRLDSEAYRALSGRGAGVPEGLAAETEAISDAEGAAPPPTQRAQRKSGSGST